MRDLLVKHVYKDLDPQHKFKGTEGRKIVLESKPWQLFINFVEHLEIPLS